MGRSKKKISSSKQEGEKSVKDVPAPRKRGRPKKIVETKVETDYDTEEEEEEEEKHKKTFEELAASTQEGSFSALGKRKDDEEDEEEDPSKSKPKVIKRQGMSRRKGEPRRAAE